MNDPKTTLPTDRKTAPAASAATDIEAELATPPATGVVAELKPEVKAELKTDVRTTLEELAQTGRSIEERFARRVKINSPRRNNAKLCALLELVNEDDDLYGQWMAANVNAMERVLLVIPPAPGGRVFRLDRFRLEGTRGSRETARRPGC